MAPIPNRPGENTDVTDWLQGRGGAVVTVLVVVLLIWGVITQVVG